MNRYIAISITADIHVVRDMTTGRIISRAFTRDAAMARAACLNRASR